MKKTNQTARETAVEILLKIEKHEAYSNLLINRAVEINRFSPKDTALLTRIVYGTIQRKNTLDFYLNAFLKKEPESWVRVLLRLALYQMVYLDRVPDRAVLHESVEIAKRRGHKGIAGLVNGVLRSVQRQGLPSPDKVKDPVARLALETSHPEWLLDRWLLEYEAETVRKICEANNTLPEITIRTNTLKMDKASLLNKLQEEGLEVSPGVLAPEALKVEKGVVQHTDSFKAGLFAIQDESSMLPAHALDVGQGMQVLDACAAPGGKTTHIAQLMKNSGNVIALDLHAHKMNLIKQSAERLGLTNISTEAFDSRKAGERFKEESFDRILVDAPCSGFGVIRRKPDIKWGKSAEDVSVLAKVQGEILRAVAPLLKPGGKLVYSTCTIEKEENEKVVAAFLEENESFSFDRTLPDRLACPVERGGQLQILPHQYGTDGFFIAVLQKEETG